MRRKEMPMEFDRNPVGKKDLAESKPQEPKVPIDARSELEVLIRARYPLIYVVSWEEERVMHELDRIAQTLDKKVYAWDINHGISRYRRAVEGKIEGKKGTKDPILAIREIAEITDPSIFVMKDYHAYVKDSTVIRGLRNLAATLRQTYVSVVIPYVSPLGNLTVRADFNGDVAKPVLQVNITAYEPSGTLHQLFLG